MYIYYMDDINGSHLKKSHLFSFAETLRNRYPDSVLGFLGNSLGVPAIVDRYQSTKNSKEQYIIPFSATYLECNLSSIQNYFSSGHYHYTLCHAFRSDYGSRRIEDYQKFINQSDISPKNIIGKGKELVVVDRVCQGLGLANFGHVWNTLARNEGFTQEQIDEKFKLCAIPNFAASQYTDFKIVDQKSSQVFHAGKFDRLEIAERDLRTAVFLDDKRQDLRISPYQAIGCFKDAKKDITSCCKLIDFIYEGLSSNKKALTIPYLMSASDKKYSETSGLILQ